MKEKDKLIIETAIKLFAHKGFTNTSIQEIAHESGISKGAFYLHFKSKDSLLLSILEYYYEKLQANIFAHHDQDFQPRELFSTQLITLLDTLLEHKEFIIMQSREQAIPINDSVKAFIFKMQEDTHKFYQQGMRSIYGERIDDHLWDLSMILDGLLQSYIKLLLINPSQLETTKMVPFILRRLDHIVDGISNEEPLLTGKIVENFVQKTKSVFLSEGPKIQSVLKLLRQNIEEIDKHEDLLVSLDVLEAEINKESPRLPVLQGMLSNFKEYPQLEKFRKEISSIYQFKI
ncbi:TetR/AcrR family transcriptional regulator [Litchfieldia salsa]|uniref:DNA-binding transcriptional regulator, AcrR family n=1 Tax=Litchfieldia salsa TaxID=930152 RepID=A0A1H0WPJ3_9BACI|nr:TetR/AcrR family transcriptional regulator [Litchfieldia salsa]SDP92365.1 DNA-binding transcriptional regulator, AcrR family [Litchfieldia salsa]